MTAEIDAEAIVNRWRDAIVNKDWAVFAQLYADDAVAMAPTVPLICGRAKIAEWFSTPGISVTAFAAQAVAVEGDGRVVAIRTAYTMTFSPPGASAALTEHGKGVLVLRRGSDDSWRIAIDIWNANAPAAEAV